MPRTIQLAPDRILANEGEIVVELSNADIATLALEVTLLLNRFSESVSLRSGAAKIVVRLAEEGSTDVVFHREDAGQITCSLTRDGAGYIQATLLRAYRDGMAEVNHIHVEGTLDGRGFDLTLFFPTSRPPMTPEEASRLTRD